AEATETASSKQAASLAKRPRKQVTAAPHEIEPALVSLKEEPVLERFPSRQDRATAQRTWHAFPRRPSATQLPFALRAMRSSRRVQSLQEPGCGLESPYRQRPSA